MFIRNFPASIELINYSEDSWLLLDKVDTICFKTDHQALSFILNNMKEMSVSRKVTVTHSPKQACTDLR